LPESTTLINVSKEANDANSLRNRFDISKDIVDGRLLPSIGAASRRLKLWIGTEAYADALSETPTDELRKADLENAEAALAMHFALPGLNSKVTPAGIVKTTKEGGAMAGNVVFSYLTPNESKQLSQMYFEQAEEIARPYLLDDGTPNAEFAVTDE
jgi:hypothetical protein